MFTDSKHQEINANSSDLISNMKNDVFKTNTLSFTELSYISIPQKLNLSQVIKTMFVRFINTENDTNYKKPYFKDAI